MRPEHPTMWDAYGFEGCEYVQHPGLRVGARRNPSGRTKLFSHLSSVLLWPILSSMNPHPPVLKRHARSLRTQGLSYNEIRKRLNLSKSTVSVWCRDILLTPPQQRRLYTKQIEILSRGSQSQKERRAREVEKIIRDAEKEIRLPLSRETLRLMGTALYWAEGSKGKRFQLTNSDPTMIVFMIKWIHSMFNIKATTLTARLNIYSQQNEGSIKRFWSSLTGIPMRNFGKSFVKPPSKNYRTNNLYYGTIRIEVPKSADLRHRVHGWVKAALRQLAPNVGKIEQQWRQLKNVPRPVNLDSSYHGRP